MPGCSSSAAARVVLAAQPALGRLLASRPDLDELFIARFDQELPRTDFYLPLLSAPAALGTTPRRFPVGFPTCGPIPG